MAIINVILARYAGGYHEVKNQPSIDTYGRCEALIQLGAVSDQQTVESIAARIFALEATPIVAASAGIQPGGSADEPYNGYDVGDYITAPDQTGTPAQQRVMALTVAEDDNGYLVFTPQLNSMIFEEDQRLQNWLKSMAQGTAAGTVVSAQPIPPTQNPSVKPAPQSTGPAALGELPPYTMSGGLIVTTWGRYRMPIAANLTYLNVELDQTSTSGNVQFQVVVNGTPITASLVTIAPGATEGRTPFAYSVNVGDKIQMQCVAAGTGVSLADCQLGYT